MTEDDDELEAFMAAVDRMLTQHFGPDHQQVMSQAGSEVAAFEWRDGGTQV